MVLTIYTIENGKSVNDTIGTGKPDIDRRSMKTQCSKTIASWSSGALKHREPFLSYDASYVHSCNWKTLPRLSKRRDALIQNSYIESLEASESFNSTLYLFYITYMFDPLFVSLSISSSTFQSDSHKDWKWLYSKDGDGGLVMELEAGDGDVQEGHGSDSVVTNSCRMSSIWIAVARSSDCWRIGSCIMTFNTPGQRCLISLKRSSHPIVSLRNR